MYISFTINHPPVSKPHYLHLYPQSLEISHYCLYHLHTLWCLHAPYYYKFPAIKIQGRKGVASMIKYDPLWQTLRAKNISQYQLIKDYGIDKAQLQRLRKNMVVKIIILNRLCQILDCRIEDIMEYVPDDK